MFRLASIPILLFAAATPAAALKIQIDYTYDTGNFFNTAEKRAAMQAAADFFGGLIQDPLLRIDRQDFPVSSWTPQFFHPATGVWISGTPNLVVPADTVIIHVGARVLPSQVSGEGGPGGYSASTSNPGWFDHLESRGKPGVLSTPPTGFALWGGSISFNSAATWNFSLSQNQTGREFLRVALHELGHVFGIGTADSWKSQVSGGKFHGAAAIRSHGSAPPADLSHLQTSGGSLASRRFGAFGVPHGTTRPALMLPSSSDDASNFDLATDLDLACLVDIGWNIRPTPVLRVTALTPAAASFNWPSVSFFEYRVERGADLAWLPAGSAVVAGNGGVQNWADPAPPPSRAFYRLSATPIPRVAATAMAVAQGEAEATSGNTGTIDVQPRWVRGCECPAH